MDRHRETSGQPRNRPPALRLPDDVLRLLQLRPRLYARVCRPGAISRAHRAPAGVARGYRLRRQESRRDRLRRDGGHADPGNGAGHGANYDAAALAHVHGIDAGFRPDRQYPAPTAAGETRLPPDPLEEYSLPALHLLAHAGSPRKGPGQTPEDGAQGARQRRGFRSQFRAALRPLGPAPVPGAERRLLPRDPRWRRVGRDRPDRDVHRERHIAEVGSRARGRHHRDGDRTRSLCTG